MIEKKLVEALLCIPRLNGMIPLVKIQNYIKADTETILEGLRSLYKANRISHQRAGDTDIFALVDGSTELARQDAEWVTSKLELTDWQEIGDDFYQAVATPTEAFWKEWHSDKHAISRRQLYVDYDENRRWRVYCSNDALAEILLKGENQ